MTAGQTIVEYNGASIFQCQTLRFEQREERDPTGMDTLFHHFTVTVAGYAHAKSITGPAAPYVYPAVGPDAATVTANFRRLLSEPRKEFKMRVGCDAAGAGGVELLQASPDQTGQLDAARDLNNGPRCTELSIRSIVANELFRIEATFEASLPLCQGTLPGEARVLSNRWSVTDAIDANRYTTRTYAGRLRVTAGTISPHSFRRMVSPMIMPGMRLESMDFDASADGLWLNYTVVHREVAYSAPEPATSWEISHTERTAFDRPIGIGELSITLTGDRDVDRRELIALGLRIVNDRLREGITLRVNDHRILQLAITDYFGSEGPLRVTINASVEHIIKGGDNAVANDNDKLFFAKEKLGTPIDSAVLEWMANYNSNYSRNGRPGESPPTDGPVTLVGAFATYLQSICENRHDMGCGVDTPLVSDGGIRRCTQPSVSARVSTSLPDEPPSWSSPSHAEAIYTSYRMESRYETPAHRIAMPIAKDYYGSGDTQAVIGLAPPTSNRVMRIYAARVGQEPSLPSPVDSYQDGENTAKLLKVVVLPTVPERGPDGHQLFEAHAEYHYALTQPLKTNSLPRVGVNPWEVGPVYRSSPSLVGAYSEDTKA